MSSTPIRRHGALERVLIRAWAALTPYHGDLLQRRVRPRSGVNLLTLPFFETTWISDPARQARSSCSNDSTMSLRAGSASVVVGEHHDREAGDRGRILD